MEIKVSKKDFFWSYLAKFFNLASGLIILPLFLKFLSSEEVGMNYLMITVSSMVALLDFGFTPQFSKNITYAISGVNSIKVDGVENIRSNTPNYRLLSIVIQTSKYVYKRISQVVLIIMLTLGSAYIYKVTNGFTNVNNAFIIWITYSVSIFFNTYFNYLNCLLVGSGKIYESNIGLILSKVTYIIICITLLIVGYGLYSIIIANIIAPFVQRYYSYKVFYTDEMKSYLTHEVTKNEIKETFNTIWYNAKKLGINFVGAYLINKCSMFLIGFYFSLEIIASYGLLIQLAGVLSSVSSITLSTFYPRLSNLIVLNDTQGIKRILAITNIIYWICMLMGCVTIILFAPYTLSLIGSNTVLPSKTICIIYLIIIALEQNHSNFATIITSYNTVPFVKAAIYSGIAILVLTLISLQFTKLELLGVILAQGLVQISYNNWYWPKYVLQHNNLNIYQLFYLGIKEINSIIKINKNKNEDTF